MKITTTVEIHRSRAEIAPLVADSSLSKRWMEDLESYEPLPNPHGKERHAARLTFKNGMVFISTVTLNDLPNEIHTTLESSFASIKTTARLDTLSHDKTLYTFEQDFSFNSILHKAIGFIGQNMIRRQQGRHVEGFKRFVEGEPIAVGMKNDS